MRLVVTFRKTGFGVTSSPSDRLAAVVAHVGTYPFPGSRCRTLRSFSPLPITDSTQPVAISRLALR